MSTPSKETFWNESLLWNGIPYETVDLFSVRLVRGGRGLLSKEINISLSSKEMGLGRLKMECKSKVYSNPIDNEVRKDKAKGQLLKIFLFF